MKPKFIGANRDLDHFSKRPDFLKSRPRGQLNLVSNSLKVFHQKYMVANTNFRTEMSNHEVSCNTQVITFDD